MAPGCTRMNTKFEATNEHKPVVRHLFRLR